MSHTNDHVLQEQNTPTLHYSPRFTEPLQTEIAPGLVLSTLMHTMTVQGMDVARKGETILFDRTNEVQTQMPYMDAIEHQITAEALKALLTEYDLAAKEDD